MPRIKIEPSRIILLYLTALNFITREIKQIMRICILCSFDLHCKIYVPEKVHYYISSFLPLFHKLSHTRGIYPVANIFILKFTYQGGNILPFLGSFFSIVSRHFYLPFYICETEDEGLHTSFPSSFLTVC